MHYAHISKAFDDNQVFLFGKEERIKKNQAASRQSFFDIFYRICLSVVYRRSADLFPTYMVNYYVSVVGMMEMYFILSIRPWEKYQFISEKKWKLNAFIWNEQQQRERKKINEKKNENI